MFEIVSSLLRYIFITVIYLFIYGVMRLIYLDIESMKERQKDPGGKLPYLKLINRRDSLGFKLEEAYLLDGSKTLGRSGKCDITIQDPFISSEHVRLVQKEGTFYIEDLGSKNGTFVNGQRITGELMPLKSGDRVQMGQLDLLYVNNAT